MKRRDFVNAAAAGTALTVIPSGVLDAKSGRPPSDKINVAGIGVAGMGAAKLTELVLLGSLALRAGRKVEWDAENIRASNVPDAERYVKGNYRKGWSL